MITLELEGCFRYSHPGNQYGDQSSSYCCQVFRISSKFMVNDMGLGHFTLVFRHSANRTTNWLDVCQPWVSSTHFWHHCCAYQVMLVAAPRRGLSSWRMHRNALGKRQDGHWETGEDTLGSLDWGAVQLASEEVFYVYVSMPMTKLPSRQPAFIPQAMGEISARLSWPDVRDPVGHNTLPPFKRR